MGFEVAAIGRGADKAELAKKLGAHHYVDSTSVDPGQGLAGVGRRRAGDRDRIRR
jgi:D-arabinose 1-dehydrogenase-like Zn-dependent alcohol dehydrogenase